MQRVPWELTTLDLYGFLQPYHCSVFGLALKMRAAEF